MLLHPAAGLENPVPFLDAPPPAVKTHQLPRLCPGLNFLGGQQHPFNRLGLRRWFRFPYIDRPQRERRTEIAAGGRQGDFRKAHTQLGGPRRQAFLFRLVPFGRLASLPRNRHFEAGLVLARLQGFPQLLFLSLQTPVVIGAHQHSHPLPRRQTARKCPLPGPPPSAGASPASPPPPPHNPSALLSTGTTFSPRSVATATASRLRSSPPAPPPPTAALPAAALPVSAPPRNAASVPATSPPSDWFPLLPSPSSSVASKNSDPSCPAPPAPEDDATSVAGCVSGAWLSSLPGSGPLAGCR